MCKLEPGTKIGEVDCPGCGEATPLKINKAGCAYIFCARPVAEGSAERCYTRVNWGRTATKKLVKQYNEENNVKHQVEQEKPWERTDRGDEGVTDRGEPETSESVREQSGLIAGFKHFFTE